ncbi:MAG TPA: YfhO family protein, partial [Nitrospirota bacterium]|nr:YfhO family protein [Nitrospirota bacterium]
KFLSLGILILSVTAGLGLHLLQEKKKEDPAESKFLTIVFVSAFVAACVLAVFAIGHNSLVDYLKAKGLDVPRYNSATVNLSNAKRTLFYLALYGVILKAGLETQWKKWTLFVLSIALAGDLFGNMGYYQSMKTKEYFEPSWVVKQLARDKDLFRVLVTPKTSTLTTIVAADVQPLTVANQLLTPSLNLIYKIYDVRGAEVMRLEKMEEVYNAFVFSPAVDATNLANLFNIKYVITTTPIQSRDYQLVAAHTEGLKGSLGKLMKQPTVKIYKNHEWAPRAFLVDDYKIMKNSDMLPVMMKKDFRPDRVVLLEEKPIWAGREPQGTRGGGKRRADIASISNNRVELTTESPRKSILVLSDAYYPGWKAVVDGEGRKIYRADNAFRAVPLEAGRHVVEFVYDPASFKWGLAISLFTVLAISAMGAVYYYRKRRTV